MPFKRSYSLQPSNLFKRIFLSHLLTNATHSLYMHEGIPKMHRARLILRLRILILRAANLNQDFLDRLDNTCHLFFSKRLNTSNTKCKRFHLE